LRRLRATARAVGEVPHPDRDIKTADVTAFLRGLDRSGL
jgi:hypothetical protein